MKQQNRSHRRAFATVLLIAASLYPLPTARATSGGPGSSPGSPSSASPGGGNGPQGNGQSQGQSQQPQGQSGSPASIEGTILAFNAVQANAASIAAAVKKSVATKTVFIMSQTEAGTVLVEDLVSEQLRDYQTQGRLLDLTLTKDITPPKGGLASLSLPPVSGTEVITNMASIATMVEGGLPTITDTFSNVSADSDSLVYAVAKTLGDSGVTIYLPGLFPPPSAMDADGSLPRLLGDLGRLQARIQGGVNWINAHNPKATPLLVLPEGITWNDKMLLDAGDGQVWLTAFAAFLKTIATPDTTGVSPLAHSVSSSFVQQALRTKPDDTFVLILRGETTTAAERNDKGFFWKLWLIPQPHNVFTYGGVSAADYALFDGHGKVLKSGLLRKGITHMKESDFDKSFGDPKGKTAVKADLQTE